MSESPESTPPGSVVPERTDFDSLTNPNHPSLQRSHHTRGSDARLGSIDDNILGQYPATRRIPLRQAPVSQLAAPLSPEQKQRLQEIDAARVARMVEDQELEAAVARAQAEVDKMTRAKALRFQEVQTIKEEEDKEMNEIFGDPSDMIDSKIDAKLDYVERKLNCRIDEVKQEVQAIRLEVHSIDSKLDQMLQLFIGSKPASEAPSQSPEQSNDPADHSGPTFRLPHQQTALAVSKLSDFHNTPATLGSFQTANSKDMQPRSTAGDSRTPPSSAQNLIVHLGGALADQPSKPPPLDLEGLVIQRATNRQAEVTARQMQSGLLSSLHASDPDPSSHSSGRPVITDSGPPRPSFTPLGQDHLPPRSVTTGPPRFPDKPTGQVDSSLSELATGHSVEDQQLDSSHAIGKDFNHDGKAIGHRPLINAASSEGFSFGRNRPEAPSATLVRTVQTSYPDRHDHHQKGFVLDGQSGNLVAPYGMPLKQSDAPPPLPPGASFPNAKGAVEFHKAAKSVSDHVATNAMSYQTYIYYQLAHVFSLTQNNPNFIGRYLPEILQKVSSERIRAALLACCTSSTNGTATWDREIFRKLLASPQELERRVLLIIQSGKIPQFKPPDPSQETGRFMKIATRCQAAVDAKRSTVTDTLQSSVDINLTEFSFDWAPPSDLLLVILNIAKREWGYPTQVEIESLCSKTKPMIVMGIADPFYNGSEETPMGLVRRVCMIADLFTEDRPEILEALLHRGVTSALDLVHIAIRCSPDHKYLYTVLKDLAGKAPMSQRALGDDLLVAIIADLEAIYHSRNNNAFMSLIRPLSAISSSTVEQATGLQTTLSSDAVPGTKRGFPYRKFPPSKTLAANATGYDHDHEEEEPCEQPHQLVAAAGAVADSSNTQVRPAMPLSVNPRANGRSPHLNLATKPGQPSPFPQAPRPDRPQPTNQAVRDFIQRVCYLCGGDHPVVKCKELEDLRRLRHEIMQSGTPLDKVNVETISKVWSVFQKLQSVTPSQALTAAATEFTAVMDDRGQPEENANLDEEDVIYEFEDDNAGLPSTFHALTSRFTFSDETDSDDDEDQEDQLDTIAERFNPSLLSHGLRLDVLNPHNIFINDVIIVDPQGAHIVPILVTSFAITDKDSDSSSDAGSSLPSLDSVLTEADPSLPSNSVLTEADPSLPSNPVLTEAGPSLPFNSVRTGFPLPPEGPPPRPSILINPDLQDTIYQSHGVLQETFNTIMQIRDVTNLLGPQHDSSSNYSNRIIFEVENLLDRRTENLLLRVTNLADSVAMLKKDLKDIKKNQAANAQASKAAFDKNAEHIDRVVHEIKIMSAQFHYSLKSQQESLKQQMEYTQSFFLNLKDVVNIQLDGNSYITRLNHNAAMDSKKIARLEESHTSLVYTLDKILHQLSVITDKLSPLDESNEGSEQEEYELAALTTSIPSTLQTSRSLDSSQEAPHAPSPGYTHQHRTSAYNDAQNVFVPLAETLQVVSVILTERINKATILLETFNQNAGQVQILSNESDFDTETFDLDGLIFPRNMLSLHWLQSLLQSEATKALFCRGFDYYPASIHNDPLRHSVHAYFADPDHSLLLRLIHTLPPPALLGLQRFLNEYQPFWTSTFIEPESCHLPGFTWSYPGSLFHLGSFLTQLYAHVREIAEVGHLLLHSLQQRGGVYQSLEHSCVPIIGMAQWASFPSVLILEPSLLRGLTYPQWQQHLSYLYAADLSIRQKSPVPPEVIKSSQAFDWCVAQGATPHAPLSSTTPPADASILLSGNVLFELVSAASAATPLLDSDSTAWICPSWRPRVKSLLQDPDKSWMTPFQVEKDKIAAESAKDGAHYSFYRAFAFISDDDGHPHEPPPHAAATHTFACDTADSEDDSSGPLIAAATQPISARSRVPKPAGHTPNRDFYLSSLPLPSGSSSLSKMPPFPLQGSSSLSKMPPPFHTTQYGSSLSTGQPQPSLRSFLPKPSSTSPFGFPGLSHPNDQPLARSHTSNVHAAQVLLPLAQASVADSTSSSYEPPDAPNDVQAMIDVIVIDTKEVHLDYYDQDASSRVSLLVPRSLQLYIPATAVLSDPGASVHVASRKMCQDAGIQIYKAKVRGKLIKLATSTLNGQSVFGVTEPIIIQFGTLTNFVSMTIAALVVDGCDKLYQLLISNEAAHRFRGIIDYGTNTITYHNSADGEPVVLPLRPKP